MHTDKSDKKTLVFDTSGFLAGLDPFSITEEQYTTPMVRGEITRNTQLLLKLKIAIESGKIKIQSPSKKFLELVRTAATISGDTNILSEVDIQVLALALELDSQGHTPLIVTDDYSIQNVANQMGIEFTAVTTLGIRFQLKWIRYCPACKRKYPADYRSSMCEVCGTSLKRKPTKKKLITRNS